MGGARKGWFLLRGSLLWLLFCHQSYGKGDRGQGQEGVSLHSHSICERSRNGKRVSVSDSKKATTLPVFVKMHKVGGTTISTIIDCVSTRRPSLSSLVSVWGSGRAAEVEWTQRERRLAGKACPHSSFGGWNGPWSHNAMAMYRGRGTSFFTQCLGLGGGPPVRIFTLLRHPTERLFSGISFFATAADKAMILKPLFNEPKKWTFLDLKTSAEKIIAHWPHEMGTHQYLDMLLDNSTDTHIKRESFSAVELRTAKTRLESDFIVGITERMTEFVALLTLELGFDAKDMCSPVAQARKAIAKSHGNSSSSHRYRELFSHEAILELEASWLAPDIELYEFAVELAKCQENKHGEAFTERIEYARSEGFHDTCEKLRNSDRLGGLGVTCGLPAKKNKGIQRAPAHAQKKTMDRTPNGVKLLSTFPTTTTTTTTAA